MAQLTVEVSLKDPRIGSKNSSERKIENISSEDYRLRHKIHVVINYILTNVIYYFFVNNLRQLLENVSMNICLKGGTNKFFVILRLSPNIIEFNMKPNCLDSGPMTGMQKDKLKRVLNFCRLFSLSTMVFYEGGSLIYPLATALSHGTQLSLENWVPYEWRKNAFCYWSSLLMQTMFQLQLALVQEANDSFAVLYVCVLSAHLQIIMERLANIHYDPEKTEKESFQDFIQCLEDHRSIMEIFEIIHFIIFMRMRQKKKIILAGKQIPITWVTFISVMKAMYKILMVLNASE